MTTRWGSDQNDAARRRNVSTVPPCPDVAEQLRQLDCDPLAGMARLAMDEAQPAPLRARMYAELAAYVAPRRKAIEVTGPGDVAPSVSFHFDALSIEELETLRSLLIKAGVRPQP